MPDAEIIPFPVRVDRNLANLALVTDLLAALDDINDILEGDDPA